MTVWRAGRYIQWSLVLPGNAKAHLYNLLQGYLPLPASGQEGCHSACHIHSPHHHAGPGSTQVTVLPRAWPLLSGPGDEQHDISSVQAEWAQ